MTAKVSIDRQVVYLKAAISAHDIGMQRVKNFAVDTVAANYSREGWTAEKSAILATLVIPALPQKEQVALSRDLIKKGTKAWDALDTRAQEEQAAAQAAKTAAMKIAHQWHRRLGAYAWPPEAAAKPAAKEGSAGESSPALEGVTLKTRIAGQVADLIKKCQSAEEADFDITGTIAALNAVMAAIAKPIGV